MAIQWWGRGIAVALTSVLALGACGGAGPLGAPVKSKDPLAGEYAAKGASAASEVAKALAKKFSELHSGVNMKLEDTDTETSIVVVGQGDVDFGYIGREPKATEAKVTITPIGFTGSAVALNAANPVKNLTKDQMRKIFSGEIKDWAQVGGDAGAIKVFVREATSSTRTTIEAWVFGSDKPTYVADRVEIFESDATLQAIASFKNSIGTVTLSAKNGSDKTIRLVSLDGIAATVQSLNTGPWPIRRPLYLTTNPDPAKVKPAIKAFLEFIKGPDGQKIVSGE